MNYIGQNFPTEDEELPSTSYANIARMSAEGSAPEGGDAESVAVPAGVRSKKDQSGIMSKDEADQYLATRRAQTAPAQSNAIMSKDEADDYLAQRRAGKSQAASTEGAVPSNSPAASAAPQDSPPLGVGISTLFSKLPPALQNIIREHPYMSGAVAAGAIPLAIGAGAMVPEAALGGAAMWAGRNLIGPVIRRGAEVAGVGEALDLLTGGHFTPKLIDLISRLGEGGATP